MSYDHRSNAGNEGDVLKHAILAALVQDLLPTSGDRVFRYAEAHAGRGRSLLLAGGAWERGIGRLGTTASWPASRPLAPYRENCLFGKSDGAATTGDSYLGSAALVLRLLERHGVAYQLYLFETDAAAARDLCAYVAAHAVHPANVTVFDGDGYEGVKGLSGLDLALVDPPTRDEERVEDFLRTPPHGLKNLLVWTPRSCAGSGDSGNPLPGRESKASREWLASLRDLPSALPQKRMERAAWDGWAGSTRDLAGCAVAGWFSATSTHGAMGSGAAATRALMAWPED